MIYWFGMWAIKPMDIKSLPVEEKIFIPIVNSAVFLVSQKKWKYYDFGVGHSSTSISAALGMAIASNLKGENKHHIAIIGDASIASGGFWRVKSRGSYWCYTLILNDNAIGIDPSVGALKQYLTA
jgi:deoxyxylulose-5-phosphate synthase